LVRAFSAAARDEALADRRDDRVERQRGLVGARADLREPRREADHAVELVAVEHQQAAAVGRVVHHLALHEDAAEGEPRELPRRVVVVAGDVDHLGALANLPEQLLHNVVVRLRPVPPLRQRPAVHDIAHEHPAVRLVVRQEVEHALGLAAAHPEVEVR
jgi:hypothetical protein